MRNIYSKNFCLLIQLISLVALIILFIVNTLKIYICTKEGILFTDCINIFSIIINYIVCMLCGILIIFPVKYELIGIISIFYSILISIIDINNAMNVLMIYLAFICFYTRGYYKMKKKFKIIVTLGICFSLIYFPLIFTKKFNIEILLIKLAYLFICYTSFMFLTLNNKNDDYQENVLNISKYEKLSKRDAEWLSLIIQGEKYENISRNYKLSEGYVRTRISLIYETLKVGDKTGFLNKYGKYKIIFE